MLKVRLNLRKVVVIATCFAVAVTMFSGCKNNNKQNKPDKPEKSETSEAKKIKPSELITLKDAERILGWDMEINGELDKPESLGGLRTVYKYNGTRSWDFELFQIAVKQKSLLIEKKEYMITSAMKKHCEEDETRISVEGLGKWAYIVNLNSEEGIKIFYIAPDNDNYFIEISLSGNDADWKIEKLKEAGKLAVDRLNAILN